MTGIIFSLLGTVWKNLLVLYHYRSLICTKKHTGGLKTTLHRHRRHHRRRDRYHFYH